MPLELTTGQRLVATSIDPSSRYTLVSACPGSGKSTTICARANHLLRHGVPSSDILMLTFSVKARKDLQAKLACVAGAASRCHVYTFHAFALKLITAHDERTGAGPSAAPLLGSAASSLTGARRERSTQRTTNILSGRELNEALRSAASTCARADGSVVRADDDELRSLLTILELKKAGAPTPRATDWAYRVLDAYERVKQRSTTSLSGGGNVRVRDFADIIIDATTLLATNAQPLPLAPFPVPPPLIGGSASQVGNWRPQAGAQHGAYTQVDVCGSHALRQSADTYSAAGGGTFGGDGHFVGTGGSGSTLQAALGCSAHGLHLMLDEVLCAFASASVLHPSRHGHTHTHTACIVLFCIAYLLPPLPLHSRLCRVVLRCSQVQDVTKSQLLLVQALLPFCRSLVAVGDLDQSIVRTGCPKACALYV